MVTGTPAQFELVQEALNRWWGPLMQFHGNPIPRDEDPMWHWRIKSQGNEEARQQFLEGYVPQIRELGLEIPDPKLRRGEDGVWDVHRAGLGRAAPRRHRPRPEDGGAPRLPRALPRAGAVGARRGARRMTRRSSRSSGRSGRGRPFEHAGSLVAPDADFAEAWAREQYGRRGESAALWLVPREAIRHVEDWADEFDLKYRRVDGYSIKARLKEAGTCRHG